MKMSRDQLKALVKQCLVELLMEGLGDVPIEVAPPRLPVLRPGVAESRRRPDRRAHDPALDTPVSQGRVPSSALKEAVRREAGGNAMMEAIFADTARTTLPSMLSHGDVGTPSPGHGSGPSITQQEQFNGRPEEVFGEENAARWADLAFMDPQAKKTA